MIPDDIERCALLGWRMYPRAARHRAAAFEGAAKLATCDLDQLAKWSAEFPGCGWYCCTGASGIWALDIDAPPKANGVESMRALIAKHGALPERPVIRTGGGGYCMIFAHHSEPLRGQAGVPATGLDPRRGAQTITLPPTVHHVTGKPYEWLAAPWRVNPPQAPGWLLRLLKPLPEPAIPHVTPAEMSDRSVTQAIYGAIDRVMDAHEGKRNETLNRSAYRLAMLSASGRLGRQNAEQLLIEAASRIGLPRHEARATINSAFRSAFRA